MPFPGLVLPEEVVRNICQTTVDKLDASDFTIVDWAVGQLTDAERDSMRTAFRNRPGKARLGFHLEDGEDWQITVVLAGMDNNPYRSVGDVVGPQEEEPLGSSMLTADITAARGVLLSLDVEPPVDAGDSGRVRLDDEVAVWSRGAGGVTLTYRGVQGTVAVAHPAGTLAVFHRLVERAGWGENVQVRCDVHSSDAWFNMILTTVVRAAFLSNARAFETAGLTLHNVLETDMAPRPEFWPATLYHRTLMVTVQRDFAVPDELSVILDIQTEVNAVCGPNGGC